MDPVSLVAAALAVGLSETVTSAVRDSYAELRNALLRRLHRGQGGDVPDAEATVMSLEALHDTPEELRAGIRAAGVTSEQAVLGAARRVLLAAEHSGIQVGKYVVDLHDAKGVQVGDNPTMTITF
jgi:hypothetical protein